MTSYTRLIVITAVGIACATAQSTPTLSPGLAQVVKEFDRTATAAVEIGASSFGLAVATRDGVAWTKNYGYEDAEHKSAANADTSYRVGVGAFTGIMLLQLIRDSKVHLSDRVDKYVPEIARIPVRYPNSAPLTLVQLATHATGLELPAEAASSRSTISQWENAVIAALPHFRFAEEPGTHVSESPINEAVLAIALSRAAGQSYFEYVKRKILAPLGMTHTDFDANAKMGEELTVAASTTIGDMVRFAQFEMLGGPDAVLPR